MTLTPNQRLVLDLLGYAPVLVFVAALVDALHWTWQRKRGLLTPFQQRQRFRRFAIFLATGMGMLATLQATRDLMIYHLGLHNILQAGLFLASIVMLMVHPSYRKPNEKDADRHFGQNPRHCGRCDYDLTGNVSGVCPECGWTIPSTPMRVEDPHWQWWWRQWRIDYLEHWRAKCAIFLAGALTMPGLAAVLVFMLLKLTRNPLFGQPPYANPLLVILPLIAVAVAGCSSVHLAITVLRIGSYGLRQRRQAAGYEETPRVE
jgi:hypothetical protein